MLVPQTTRKIQVSCPICKTRDIIGIPPRSLNRNSHLTTISIHKGLICPHHFQVFVDKNMQIRGYQKVDFELNLNNSTLLGNGVKAFKGEDQECKTLFNNQNQEKKIPIFRLAQSIRSKEEVEIRQKIDLGRKKMTLREIYEEFWEYIGDTNKKFRAFIKTDKRRNNSSSNSNLNRIHKYLKLDQAI